MEAKKKQTIFSLIFTMASILIIDTIAEVIFKSKTNMAIPIYVSFPVNMGLFSFLYLFVCPRLFKIRQ